MDNFCFISAHGNNVKVWHKEEVYDGSLDDGFVKYNKLLFVNGRLVHKDGSPAIETSDGDELWYNNGRLHREGGPAIDRADGSKNYYFNGELHRDDGPAIIAPGEKNQYWLSGKKFKSKKEWAHYRDYLMIME